MPRMGKNNQKRKSLSRLGVQLFDTKLEFVHIENERRYTEKRIEKGKRKPYYVSFTRHIFFPKLYDLRDTSQKDDNITMARQTDSGTPYKESHQTLCARADTQIHVESSLPHSREIRPVCAGLIGEG